MTIAEAISFASLIIIFIPVTTGLLYAWDKTPKRRRIFTRSLKAYLVLLVLLGVLHLCVDPIPLREIVKTAASSLLAGFIGLTGSVFVMLSLDRRARGLPTTRKEGREISKRSKEMRRLLKSAHTLKESLSKYAEKEMDELKRERISSIIDHCTESENTLISTCKKFRYPMGCTKDDRAIIDECIQTLQKDESALVAIQNELDSVPQN